MQLFLACAALAALIMILTATSAALSRLHAQHQKKKNALSSKHSQKRYGNIEQRNSHAVARHLHSISNQFDAKNEQDERSENKKSLRDWITILALAIAGFAAFASDIILWFQLRDARDAANLAHLDNMIALTVNTRPWIRPDQIELDGFVVLDDKAIANITVKYSNVGHSPANTVEVDATMVSLSTSALGAETARQICDKFIANPKTVGGRSVFAGQSSSEGAGAAFSGLRADRQLYIEQNYQSLIRSGKADATSRQGLANASLFATFGIAGCIAYRFEGSPDIHTTTFIGILQRRKDRPDPVGKGSGIFIDHDRMFDVRDLEVKLLDVGTVAR